MTLASAHEEKIDSAKGFKIFVRSWIPASKPRAVVVVCHGAATGADVAEGIALAADLHRRSAVPVIADLIQSHGAAQDDDSRGGS